MILVDSSVWIDYFNGHETPEVAKLDSLLGVEPLALGDIILLEVLQGFRTDAHFNTAKEILSSLTLFNMLGEEAALNAATLFRALRKQGITIRKTNDVVIANFCITHNCSLLFSDKDFLPFVDHFGLRQVSVDL
ncbi:MAG: PIN domain nuclease [Cellvibrio sp.]|uniref:type II toxin-antitoxin system VapC family toxin n=1 Tax=Cellvibrio sp. TaxID=1965322 RepID=UPI00272143AD|nr:PIN domain nuclease [Cellvibrio sp.]